MNPRLEELRRRVLEDPASITFAALAEEYRRAKLFDDAIAVCYAGLEHHPTYLSARVTLGRSLIEVDRLDEAKEHLTEVLKSAPENLPAIRGLAEIHRRQGRLPEALEQYRAAIEIAQQGAASQASNAQAGAMWARPTPVPRDQTGTEQAPAPEIVVPALVRPEEPEPIAAPRAAAIPEPVPVVVAAVPAPPAGRSAAAKVDDLERFLQLIIAARHARSLARWRK